MTEPRLGRQRLMFGLYANLDALTELKADEDGSCLEEGALTACHFVHLSIAIFVSSTDDRFPSLLDSLVQANPKKYLLNPFTRPKTTIKNPGSSDPDPSVPTPPFTNQKFTSNTRT